MCLASQWGSAVPLMRCRSYNLRMHTAERAKWKCNGLSVRADSPVSRQTGERRTFWPCPKYCDWLTWTLVYLADHGGDVCSFSSTRRDSCVYRWTSGSLSRSTITLPVAHGKVGTGWSCINSRACEIRLLNERRKVQSNRMRNNSSIIAIL